MKEWATQTHKKKVYYFNEGSSSDVDILGSKGAALSVMTRLGLPVPAGFTITTEASLEFVDDDALSTNLIQQYTQAIHELERKIGRKFGPNENDPPLLLAIRCGSSKGSISHGDIFSGVEEYISVPESWSVPGVSPTFLNIGLNDSIVCSMAKFSNLRCALDSYVRFLMGFGVHIMGVEVGKYESIIEACKASRGGASFSVSDFQYFIQKFKSLANVPSDPWMQLEWVIKSIYKKWFSASAKRYRKAMDLPTTLGIAICVQAMVYGNSSLSRSGTGFCFSRHPVTAEKCLFGRFLFDAEGDDLLIGKRQAFSMEQMAYNEQLAYEDLKTSMSILEKHYKDMQEIEFCVDAGRFYILQTRQGKRSAKASVRIAVDMVEEGLLTEKEALMRIDVDSLTYYLQDEPDSSAVDERYLLAKGHATWPGVVTGRLAFTLQDSLKIVAEGDDVIMCLKEASTEDIPSIRLASGIISLDGDHTSSIAVLCRGMGKTCVTGLDALKKFTFTDERDPFALCPDGSMLNTGDIVTMDGSTGIVYKGVIKTMKQASDKYLETVVKWSDWYRGIDVTAQTKNFGEVIDASVMAVDGIGCLETEFLFGLDTERLQLTLQMVLSPSEKERNYAIASMLSLQKEDFKNIFRAFPSKKLGIRLLDASLGSFLPHTDDDIVDIALRLNLKVTHVRSMVQSICDPDPTMGIRGCRNIAMFPEIATMQVEAIVGAALVVASEGCEVILELLLPGVFAVEEEEAATHFVQTIANKVIADYSSKGKAPDQPFKYKIGVLINTPRACLRGGDMSMDVSSVSFDVQQLTEMTIGLSKAASRKLMPTYLSKQFMKKDPFKNFDEKGTGMLMKMALMNGQKSNPYIDYIDVNAFFGDNHTSAQSIGFLHNIGVQAVACSPRFIPLLKISAAQADIIRTSKDVMKPMSTFFSLPTLS